MFCSVGVFSFSCLLTYNGIQNFCNLFIWWFLNSIGVDFDHKFREVEMTYEYTFGLMSFFEVLFIGFQGLQG